MTKEEEIEAAWLAHNTPKIRGYQRRLIRNELIKEQENRCHYCDCEMTETRPAPVKDTDATLDHKIARVHGGSDDKSNLVASCLACNQDKKTMDYDRFLQLSKR